MGQFTRIIRTSATGSGAPAVEIIAGALKGFVLTELGLNLVNATASTYALGRPAAIGITPTTPVSLISPDSPTVMSAAQLAVAWGTGPTIPAAFFRQIALPATIGAGIFWVFRAGLPSNFSAGITVPAGSSLILWTITTVSIIDVYFSIKE